MTGDLTLQRITTSAPNDIRDRLEPIPFRAGTAPTGEVPNAASDDPLPHVDVVHWAYTTAEAEALADVFTPGTHYTAWNRYARDWSSYESELTSRSPARDERCLCYWAISHVGDTTVLVLKNNLHLSTDGPSLPLRRFWGQVLSEAQPGLVVDSGTAGGVGAQVAVGDAIVADALRFDCERTFASSGFAQARYECTAAPLSAAGVGEAERLMAANAALLAPQTTRPLQVWTGDVLTTDFFAEDTADDHYGLRAYDPEARAVEMDAAVLGLVAGDLGSAMPRFISVRSASDPQMPAGSSEDAASDIYLRYGYAAQVAAECVVQVLIAGV